METTIETAVPEITQGEYTITTPAGEYTMPGLAFHTKDGSITPASMIDLLTTCLALLGNPSVDAVLKANDIILRDKNGKILFPRS